MGQNPQFNPQAPQGYVSDYYKNGMGVAPPQMGYNEQNLPIMLNQNMQIDPQHQMNFKNQNKISSNKFFKSKIDFTAPIKSL